jgi:hypothetical protein
VSSQVGAESNPSPIESNPEVKEELSDTQSGEPCSDLKQETVESSSQKFKTILSSKKRIIHRYFDELSQAYVESHNKDLNDFNLRGKKQFKNDINFLITVNYLLIKNKNDHLNMRVRTHSKLRN